MLGPVSPGRASLHPVRFGNSESAVYVVSLTQPHLLLSPALLSRLWRLSVTTHSKFKPASSFAPASSFTPGASAPRDSSSAGVPCVFLFSLCSPIFLHQGLSAPPREKLSQVVPSADPSSDWVSLIFQSVNLWEDGSPGLGSLISVHSASPLSSSHHLPDSTESIVQERYFGDTFFFLSVGARVQENDASYY